MKKYLINICIIFTVVLILLGTTAQGRQVTLSIARQIDLLSGGIIFIGFGHHKLHTGFSFERHIDSANTPVAGMNVAFKTAAGFKRAHMLFGFHSNDEVLFEIIEGGTWTQGTGTELAIFNLKRDIGDAASTVILENKGQATFTASNTVIKDVTGIAGGTVFENQYTYNASVGVNRAVESRAAGHEWVLKPDTTYIVRMTKTDANAKMSIDLHHYEHTDSNQKTTYKGD